jgi:hypothetical protein
MPIVVIGRGHICPTSTCECSKNAHESNELWEDLTRPCGEQIPQSDKCEAGPYIPVNREFRFLARKYIPDVIAMKTIKKDLSGYRSPIVADTEGNHS